MTSEIEKTVLRIIEDYCYKRNINNLVIEFSLMVTVKISKAILNNNLTHERFRSICNSHREFYFANDLNNEQFLLNLYHVIKKEMMYYEFDSVLDSLIEYKNRMENGNLKGFPKGTKEDTLRSNLAIYLNYENFCESRCGSGNSDIIIPSQKSIIETKLWKGEEYFNSGIPELKEYLLKQGYFQGFYVVYDYNRNSNIIIEKKGEKFEINYDGIRINVIFIRMNPVCPSQIYKNKKSKTRE